MNLALLSNMAMSQLGRQKAKSLLMGIGIGISVLATVLVQTGAGAFRGALDAFVTRTYPADTVRLVGLGAQSGGSVSRNNLRPADVEAILGASRGVSQWDALVEAGSREVKQGAAVTQLALNGHSHAAPEVLRRGVAEGDYFSEEDVKERGRIAVIGTTVANKLFPGKSPIGERLFIDNVGFEIKGVLEQAGVDPHGDDLDNMVHVPYTTVMEQILRTDRIAGATFRVTDAAQTEALGQRIGQLMRERHGIAAGQNDTFSVITPHMIQQMVDKSSKVFRIFVPLICAVAFIVSGLLILSIMWLSIRERQAEIGLRKALGARQRDLIRQILFEVLMLVGIAALTGLILSQLVLMLAGPWVGAKFGVAHMVASPLTMLVGVAAAMATGIVGAMLPARRAARLDPVVALR